MRRYRLPAFGAALCACALIPGCSAGTEPSTPSAATPADAPVEPGSAVPRGAAGVSPGGVTTAVDAPAESTENHYFHACRTARTWMEQQGGDPRSQIEPFLKTVQESQSAGPATFDKRWSELSPGQQSAVIVAVEAAAAALCG